MGLGRGVQLPIGILILTFISVQKTAYATSKEQFSQQSGDAEDYPLSQEDDEESTETVQLVSPGPYRQTSRPLITAHNDQVCSTWGNFHFKTFDGNVYHFPGTCNYLFASNCKSDYEEFNIQIRRTVEKDIPTFTHITLKLEGEVIELVKKQVIVNGNVVELPYSHSAMEIDRNGLYLRMFAKVGLEFKWNEEDAIVLELDGKYAGQICGLCGDFNDVPKDEFISNGMQMTALQYGNLQKMNGPEEQCEDVTVEPFNNCTDHLNTCDAVLSGPAFSACNEAINVQPYIKACEQDLCRCNNESYSFCLCNTFTEYSRQCSHSGSKPLNWRTEDQCPITCPFNMLYEECGLPCVDTCSNTEQSELCDDHCTDGCYCPKGTVYDDITSTGCIKQRECPCTFNGKTYGLGTGYKTACHDCTCAGGSWDCKALPCVGHCSIDGGSHISTFDETYYNFHGDCTYVLAKDCSNRTFSVMAEVRTCGKSETDTCLKSITVSHNGGDKTFFIKSDGTVLMDMVYAHLPIHLEGISLFEPSSSFIIVHTSYGLQMEIELKPIMQVRVRLEPHLEGTTCGLCGNFNKNPADDFMTMNGVVEGTGASFANNWKTQSDCPNVKNIHEDPCAASIENEEYAEHWCEKLSEPEGPFKECHAMLDPSTYEKNCMFDTCKCQNTEDCMCASVSAYVRACAAKGIFLDGWRSEICDKYSDECHSSQVYTYSADKCQATCHSLIEADPTCNIKFLPVDGCVCPEETYLDEDGYCVTAAKCDCYYKGSSLAHGETVHENKAICTCLQGRMSCIGTVKEPECVAPMVYFDCANVSASSKGSECQKSCQTYDVECYSPHCVSGCVCPHGMVLNEEGDCIKEDACPCVHNEVQYQPGENISVSCNTCICKDRKWQCTDKPCFGTCTVYGDGHYITFDSKRYSFSGDCQYTLAQDYCGNGNNGTFRVITENIPCGTTGTTCSKSIKYFLGGYELILHEAHIDVVERDSSVEVPYRVRYMGIYMVIESKHGVVLMWDKKTSIFIKLTSDFKSKVCGLCGNFDSNGMNDFTTRSQSVGADLLEFGNSWKVTPTCPDALETKDACTIHPYRKAWAQKQCSIIISDAFSKCHSQVDPSKYYEDCVTDSCACDAGGDCECFCTAVASYAQACSEFGVCIHWRTPDICPLFCDFYNLEGDCEWHYKPCGSPCMKTCRNPSGKCLYELSGLEGCYPKCPEDRPYFDEEKMACTASCGCYDKQGNLFRPEDKVSTEENCKSCTCTMKGFKCNYDLEACFCRYGGKKFKFNEVIYRTGDNLGGCFVATCAANGTIHREITECTTSPPSTVLTFTTNAPTSSVTSAPILTTVCVRESCTWSSWLDHSYPKHGPDGGDYEILDLMEERGENVCKTPRAIRCRAAEFPNATLDEIGQVVECNPKVGLICNNKDQSLASICNNYQVSFECCSHVPCGSTTATTTAKETNTGEVTTTSEGPTSSKHETAMPVTTVTTESTPGGESEAPITTTQSTIEIPETSTTTTTGKNTPPPSTSEIPVTESTNTPSTTTVTETTSPSVTGCEPKCQWSQWFDDKKPTSEPADGDHETFENIIASGRTICEKSEKISDIECRAEDYPDTDITEFGQNVHCNVTYGLVCNNAEQTSDEDYDDDDMKTCNNYKMRVLCCDTTHCLTPEGTTIYTTAPETTAPSTAVVTETPTTASSTSAPSTTTGTETATTTGRTVPDITESTTLPSTTSESTTGTESITTSPINPVTETNSPAETACEPKCQWSQWFDDKKPTSEPDDGDHETFENIIASGKTICEKSEKISDIECRAEDYPDTDITEFGQNVHCNVTYGLVCNNAEQTSDEDYDDDDMKTCYNYKMRVLCCDTTHCITPEGTTIHPTAPETATPSTAVVTETPTTTSSTSAPSTTTGTETATTTGRTVPDITESTTLPSTTSESTTGTESITTSPITPVTETTSPAETACEPKCQWSQWFDDKKPTSEPDDGDQETFENIIASGKTICEKSEKISDIECRAEDYPNADINKSGQNVHCNVTYGLVCNNAEQTSDDDDKGDDDMKTCYNYKMRVLCCDITHCITPEGTTRHPTAPETTGPSTAVVTETPTTGSSTSVPSTTTGTEIATTTGSTVPDITESTTLPSQTSETTTGTESTTKSPITSVTETTSPGATACEPKCQWSQWFDDKKPTSEPDDGDHETFENIRASGKTICEKSEKISDIECRAEDYPNTDITEFGQNVHCNVTYGLVCNNAEQTSDEDYDDDDMKTCYNYKMRVLCCDTTHCITPEGTTINPTAPETTTPSTAVVTETPTTASSTSTPSTTTGTETATTTGRTVPDITESTTLPSTTSESTTGTESITTSPITPVTETTSPAETACEPKCQWSQWFDDKKPTSEPDDGDHETFENIRASGKTICEKSEKISDIECRAEDYPYTDITEFGQNVHCNVTYGLVCNNAEQTSDEDYDDDDMKTCYNYKMRVLCCDTTHCITPEGTTIHPTAPETTTPSTAVVTETPTTASSTSAPSTTTGTETATTTGRTVPDITESTTLPSTTSESTTGTESITTSPITPVTETTSPAETACEPKCQWSQWFDDKKPTSEPDDGDQETFENIIASGKTICEKSEKISDIECRAEDYPNADINKSGQNVHCNVTYGLVCNNAEQTSDDDDKGDDDMKTCYNYKMRVLCCDITHCITPAGTTRHPTAPETTGPSTAVVTETPTIGSSTSVPSTTTGTEIATTTGSTVPDITESTTLPSPTSETTAGTESTTKSPITSVTETTSPGATACEPKCQWSQWFDDKKPTSEPDDGDHETFENIRASGKTICEKSEKISDIECRAEDYPYTDITEFGQNVHCNVTYGLVCNNAEQTSDEDYDDDDMKTCYNYKMRVLCCDTTHCITPEGTTIHPTAPETTTPSTAVVTETPTTASSTSAPSTTTGTETATTTGRTVPDITESTTLPSTTSESTTGTESITTSPITPVTETTSPAETACEPKCQWSQWFDDKKPTSEPDDGDQETFENIIASGKTICEKSEKISDIECRAEDYPNADINKSGQNVHCNVTYGLVCNNAEQTSDDDDKGDDDMKTCYNYKMRVLCCDITHCITPEGTTRHPTAPETTGPSTAVVTETPTIGSSTSVPSTTTGTEIATTTGSTVPDITESTTLPSPTSETTTGTESTTKSPITSVTETTSPGATACEPKCQWSQWFDDKKPTSEPDDGDHETFENIRASGKTICEKSEKISDIECRAEDYPNVDITEFGQNVHCNVSYGLVCNNAEQISDEDYDDEDDDTKTCYNYKMRVLCCDITHCITPEGTAIPITAPETTAPSTAGVTETPTTASSTSAPSTTGTKTVTTTGRTVPDVTESTTFPSTTSKSTTGTESTTTSPITPVTETTSPAATACEPKCQWSQWFDDRKPTSDPDDGDHETFENIIASGKPICEKSEKISDIECRAEDYPDTDITEFGQNVHCNVSYGLVCNNAEQTSDEDDDDEDDDMKTCYNYKMRVLCCDNSHCITSEGTTIYTKAPETTAPSTAGVTETPTTASSTSAPSTTGTETVTTTGRTVPDATESTTFPSTTSESSTGTDSTTTSRINPVTETTSPAATACEPKCQWSQWFDDKKPTSEPDDGDHETFENIIASGKTICEKSEKISDIECRAEEYPDTDITEFGQNVHCNVTYGLVCNNAEQTSDEYYDDYDTKTCYNYKMRVLCCDNTHCITPVTPEGITIYTTAPETTAPSTAVVTETPTTTSNIGSPSTIAGTEPSTTTGSITHIITETTAPSTSESAVTEITTPAITAGTESSTTTSSTSTGTEPTTTSENTGQIVTRTPSLPPITSDTTTETTTVTTSHDIKTTTSSGMTSVVSETTRAPSTTGEEIPSDETSPENTGTSTTTHHISSIPQTSEETSTSTSSQCWCHYNDLLFAPGEVVYNETDLEGCSFHAVCSELCEIDRFLGTCKHPTPPNTTTSSTSDISTLTTSPASPSESATQTTTPRPSESLPATAPHSSEVLPTTVHLPTLEMPDACYQVDPPREVGDTWEINKCVNATCEEGSNITITHRECPAVKEVTCESGLAAKQVYDQDGCCFQYECESCVGPDGKSKMPGDTWMSNCQQCACDKEKIAVECVPLTCEEITLPKCDEEGYELNKEVVPDNPCCTKMTCTCNPLLCIPSLKNCDVGFRLSSIIADGDCCAKMQCVPENVCVFNNVTYQPGSNIPQTKGSCKVCDCSEEINPETQLHDISCQDIRCNTECAPGYEYKMKDGECCGECVQNACVKTSEDGGIKVIEVGETWYPNSNRCTYYECDIIEDQFIPVSVKRACPISDDEECADEDMVLSADGCCKICRDPQPESCTVQRESVLLAHGECNATVELAACGGLCSSSSMFSSMSDAMEHKCTCCQELKTSEQKADLTCADGSVIGFSYILVEECGCKGTLCAPREGTTANKEKSRRHR